MIPVLSEELSESLTSVVEEFCRGEDVPAPQADKYALSPSKNPDHGDLATNVALLLSKPLKKNPLEIAEAIAEKLRATGRFARVEVARPGFINVTLSAAALGRVLEKIEQEGDQYGEINLGQGKPVLLEFVSANPTGPMHIGHCRHACVGDVLARILRATGYAVTTEFYVNDAGVQIENLGRSFQIRVQQAMGSPVEFPADTENYYTGEYLLDHARDFVKGKTQAEIDKMDDEDFKREAKERCLKEIKNDLAKLGVEFDSFVSEKSLYDSGGVSRALVELSNRGEVYDQDGAKWLRTEKYGDDKDRVLVKTDGSLTYIVPDIAYHHSKYVRGFEWIINLFGADHAGYPPRLRAGIACMGHDPEKLTVRLMRLVFLRKDGQRVQFSKRAGNFVALADITEEAGPDATRFFMIQRSVDTEFDFDMEIATEDNANVNPLLKVQYAHARTCSVTRMAGEKGLTRLNDIAKAAELLTHPVERESLVYLSQFPEMVARCARELDVHHIPGYLLGLADLWNRYWTMGNKDASVRVIREEEPELTGARLLLADAIRKTFANGLRILGLTAPERMVREEDSSVQ